jgi:hypothetical protein
MRHQTPVGILKNSEKRARTPGKARVRFAPDVDGAQPETGSAAAEVGDANIAMPSWPILGK